MQQVFLKRRYNYIGLHGVTSYRRQESFKLNDFSRLTCFSDKGSNIIEISFSPRPTEPSLTMQVYPPPPSTMATKMMCRHFKTVSIRTRMASHALYVTLRPSTQLQETLILLRKWTTGSFTTTSERYSNVPSEVSVTSRLSTNYKHVRVLSHCRTYLHIQMIHGFKCKIKRISVALWFKPPSFPV
jgi:hypothetical protein